MSDDNVETIETTEDTVETTEDTSTRSVKKLLEDKVPYQEMTDDEIENVIEYKAELKLASLEVQQRLAANDTYLAASLAYQQEQVVNARNRMDSLINMLMEGRNSNV